MELTNPSFCWFWPNLGCGVGSRAPIIQLPLWRNSWVWAEPCCHSPSPWQCVRPMGDTSSLTSCTWLCVLYLDRAERGSSYLTQVRWCRDACPFPTFPAALRSGQVDSNQIIEAHKPDLAWPAGKLEQLRQPVLMATSYTSWTSARKRI